MAAKKRSGKAEDGSPQRSKSKGTQKAESSNREHRVVAVSLGLNEADWVDNITEALQRAGNPKASRSFVVREAILRLKDNLEKKTPAEVLNDFIKHHSERVNRSLEL